MPGSFVRCDSFQQGLGIGADGGQRTFQVVGHPGDQLLLFLLLPLLLQRVPQLYRHGIHGIAGRAEFVRFLVADGRFRVPVLDALHPLQQDVQRFLDVGEQGAGQVQIGEGHRRQQSSQNDGCIQDNEQLQPPEHLFHLFAHAVQVLERQPQPRQIDGVQQQSQRAQPGGKEHPGDDNGHHQHDEIGAPEPFLNGHKTSLPVFCSDCTTDPGRMVKQSLKRADTFLIKSTKIRSKNWMQILKGDSHKRIKL